MADVTVRKKRNGRYEVRWRETGGRRRGRTFDRAGDADKFATKVRRTQQTGGLVELDVDNPITIAEYVEVWWRRHAMPRLAENTRRVYGRVWETHARELLGGEPVTLARTSTFEDLQLALLERDPPVGAETIRKLMTMLQSVMALAVRDDTLPTVTVNVVAARAPTVSAAPARPGGLADNGRGDPQRELADRHEAHPHGDHDAAGRGARQPPGLRRPAS